VILGIVGIVCFVVGIVYIAEPAKSLPSFIPGHLAGSTGHHPLHIVAALILGVVFLVGAWFALAYKPKAAPTAQARENSPAAHS
jgi:hypothetical protein